MSLSESIAGEQVSDGERQGIEPVMHLPMPRSRRGAVLAAAILLGAVVAAVAVPTSASAAAPTVEPVERSRAGEIVLFEVTPSSTGQLIVTAPNGATVSGIYSASGCNPAGGAVVTCGTSATVWSRPFYVGLKIDDDAPTGMLNGGSVEFRAADGTADAAPVPVTVLPPWSADTTRGGTVTVPLTIYGYGGVLRFTAPTSTRILSIANTSSCAIAADGRTADCGDGIWSGPYDAVLQVDDDAPYGSLERGTAAISTPLGATSTPFTARVIPPAPSITAVSVSVDGRTVISGAGVPDATVEVRRGDEVLGTTPTGPGTWSLQIAAAPGDRVRVLQRVADASSADTEAVVPLPTPDIRTPTSGAEVAAGSAVTGTAYTGSTVTLLVDGEPVGSAVADASGSWSVALPADLTPGAHSLVAVARFTGLEERSPERTVVIADAAVTPPPSPSPDPTPDPTAGPTPLPSADPTPEPTASSSSAPGAANDPRNPPVTSEGALASTGASSVQLLGGIAGGTACLALGAGLMIARRRAR